MHSGDTHCNRAALGLLGAVESERPEYAAYTVSDDVELVAYRADSGFTLTVALNFAAHQLVSIASNSEQWFLTRSTFEAVAMQGQ